MIDMLKNKNNRYCIGEDFTLTNDPSVFSAFRFPTKISDTIGILCHSGSFNFSIDLRPYYAEGPCLFIILAGQILETQNISDAFKGDILVMSIHLTDSIFADIHIRFPIKKPILKRPYIPLNENQLELIQDNILSMKKILIDKGNPYRKEAIINLIRAFYYGFSYKIHTTDEEITFSPNEILFENFLNLVKQNYTQEKSVSFYAEKLFLSSKHLSKLIKEVSEKTANEWITDFVILDAKSKLKTTNMTIQQVSDSLGFLTQSLFGKYFKRHVGISPKTYQKE